MGVSATVEQFAHKLDAAAEEVAKARAKAKFSALYDTKWWNTAKTIGKRAATSSVCGTSGCKACSASSMFSYTKAWHESKVSHNND